MEYYICEKQMDEGLQKTAGVKAREDVEVILSQMGCLALDIPSNDDRRRSAHGFKKLMWHFRIWKIWEKNLKKLQKGDCIYVQFPIIEHSFLLAHLFKRLSGRGIKVVLIIHDLELLRVAIRPDVSKIKKLRLKVEEKDALKHASQLIVHNIRMKKYIMRLNISGDKIIPLHIFDYLIPDLDRKKMSEQKLGKDLPVIIAGNLRPHKAQYVYQLPDNCIFNLYGVGYEGQEKEQVWYKGMFKPEELPYVLSGSFGLVWDGTSANTCSGVYGEYLQINNPHKASLYIASGIPVIIWSHAALADFVKENDCGIVVDSLSDIKGKLMNMSESEYQRLRMDTAVTADRLRSGYYMKNAVKNSRKNMEQSKVERGSDGGLEC